MLDYHSLVYLSHALVIAPLILVYAWLGDKNSPSFLRNLVITLAIVAILYHGYKYINIKIMLGKKNKENKVHNNHNH